MQMQCSVMCCIDVVVQFEQLPFAHGDHQKGGFVNLWLIISLNCPCIQIFLLVWDSGLHTMIENRGTTSGIQKLQVSYSPPPFGSADSLSLSAERGRVELEAAGALRGYHVYFISYLLVTLSVTLLVIISYFISYLLILHQLLYQLLHQLFIRGSHVSHVLTNCLTIVYVHIHMYVCIYIYIYTCYVYIYTYIHMYMQVITFLMYTLLVLFVLLRTVAIYTAILRLFIQHILRLFIQFIQFILLQYTTCVCVLYFMSVAFYVQNRYKFGVRLYLFIPGI